MAASCSIPIQSVEEEDDGTEFILSLCWDNGQLSAIYYDLLNLELKVSFFRCLNNQVRLFIFTDHE